MKYAKTSFADTWKRACERKSGEDVVEQLIAVSQHANDVSAIPDDRVLSMIAKCIFRAGFNWKVVENKWPGFEEAFLGFVPSVLVFQPDEFWDGLASDARIVRHGAKIRSVRENAQFVLDIADEYGSFGAFLAEWPEDDCVGLWDVLSKRGSRLGGNTGRYFLRFIGKDCFLPSRDVVAAVRMAGIDVAEQPRSKRDLKAVQEKFNAWQSETGLTYTKISRVCAMSAGDNIDPATLGAYTASAAGVIETD
ncbi:MAG: DNA-3-methyladenine glycosylase I [Hyphomicrobiales bacterium]